MNSLAFPRLTAWFTAWFTACRAAVFAGSVAALLMASTVSEATEFNLAYSSLALPGAPAQIFPVQVDADPALELAIVVAYTSWEEIVVEETTEIDDVSGLVEMLTIVPALLDQRELWVFDRDGDGSWTALLEPFELGSRFLTLEATDHPAMPLAGLTDEGLVALSIDFASEEPAWAEENHVVAANLLSGTRSFLPGLHWLFDLDGDPFPDLLFPGVDRWQVYLGTEQGFTAQAVTSLAAPDFDDTRTPRRLDVSLPEVRDIDGDGDYDVLLPHPVDGWADFALYRNLGGGQFEKARRPLRHRRRENDNDPLFALFEDLDGDGRAEYVRIDELEPENDAKTREEMAHAKRPPHRYEVIPAGTDFEPGPNSEIEFEALGYAVEGDSDIRLPGGFWDLDGDGRRDLVTLTLDFSMMQAVRVVVAKSLNIGLDFHIHCQASDGSFEKVEGLDLSGRFRLNLNNFRQGHLSLFDGDFDGDGRKDFVQIGRGKTVSIHRGRPGCRFPKAPDLVQELVAAPKDLALVQVDDYDGDGLSDLSVVHPESRRARNKGANIRLDLYMSDSQP